MRPSLNHPFAPYVTDSILMFYLMYFISAAIICFELTGYLHGFQINCKGEKRDLEIFTYMRT